MRLDAALPDDIASARTILSGKLGPLTLEEKDGAVWAQTEIGPALLLAAGAEILNAGKFGCGGVHLDSETG